jgi:3-hydroxybutyryl-CoA dehydrogenase
MDIKKIAVIGAGTMGNGIAHVFCQNNFMTYLVETEKAFLESGLKMISNNFDRQIKKGIIDQNQKEVSLKNIFPIVGVNNLPRDIDIIIEAISEDKIKKQHLFNELKEIANDNCIFASNTSSISITELGATSRADKFIGMHFMNPVPVMKLVEIIRGYSTSQETFERIKALVIYIGKTPVEVFDYPGFVANRILMPMINEAIFVLYENVSNANDIDIVMQLGMNHPMGPLALADFIGLDVCLAILDILYDGFSDSKYRACPLLRKMVAAGKLGRKSGSGFFSYT